jgi:hypothetical protein
MGERRFSDLGAALPGIAPNMLADRPRELPPPAARTVYAATAEGRDVVPVLGALARFGAGRLTPAADDADVRPRMAVYGLVAPYHVPEPNGSRFLARLHVDGETFDLLTDGGDLSMRRRADDVPDLELEISAHDLVAARQARAPTLPRSASARRFARPFQLA